MLTRRQFIAAGAGLLLVPHSSLAKALLKHNVSTGISDLVENGDIPKDIAVGPNITAEQFIAAQRDEKALESLVGGLVERKIKGQPLFNEGKIILYNTHFKERYLFKFRNGYGEYDPKILGSLNYFMRCNYDNKYTDMDIATIEMINYVAQLLGVKEIYINSAYRTPEYNAILARKSENVARNSFHMQGKAVDYSIPGVPISKVCQYAQLARNYFGYGGVGYYPRQNFVHNDSGPLRNWAKK
ncbi:DUF882 domain-containing protein [Oryzomonas sagensis]|uniref:Murein endopeptidase K n=1 Tax=Oryzomonas sagensis TaxID=2603857 RepID=A0ABQ6TLD2_9BACT|nr:DUF882 domain-containing protein [Oryzomonas sagensis]KAB0668693.1 DUF882 domain-containing protein [Oryzomonas sagensis]